MLSAHHHHDEGVDNTRLRHRDVSATRATRPPHLLPYPRIEKARRWRSIRDVYMSANDRTSTNKAPQRENPRRIGYIAATTWREASLSENVFSARCMACMLRVVNSRGPPAMVEGTRAVSLSRLVGR